MLLCVDLAQLQIQMVFLLSFKWNSHIVSEMQSPHSPMKPEKRSSSIKQDMPKPAKIPKLDPYESESTRRKYPCDQCGKLLGTQKTLLKHQEIHKKKTDNQLKCNECNMTFTSLNTLTKHRATQCGKEQENVSGNDRCFNIENINDKLRWIWWHRRPH